MKLQDLFNTKYDASGWTNEQKIKFLDKADALGFRVPPPIYSRFNADNAYYLNYEENERSPFGVLFVTSAPSLTNKCARKELLYKEVMAVEIEHPQKPAVEIEDQGDIDAELDAIFGKTPDPKEELQKELDASAKKWVPNDGFKYEEVTGSFFELEEELNNEELFLHVDSGPSGYYQIIETEGQLIECFRNGNVFRRKEKEWYEGVLCWVWDSSPESKAVSIIAGFDANRGISKYVSSSGVGWHNAKPLTKEELKQFMDNVPE